MITVHYHRYDDDYADVRLWTWSGDETQVSEEFPPAGIDEFGVFFHVDPTVHGNAAVIGMLPKLGPGWARKDGRDRYWKAEYGNEIYLLAGKHTVYASRPDITPHLVGAYLDSPTRLALQLSRPVAAEQIAPSRVTLTDDQGVRTELVETHLVLTDPGERRAFSAALVVSRPLDFLHRRYQVAVDGFGAALEVVPRRLLDDEAYFGDPNAVLGAVYSPERTVFRLFAPTARRVVVVLYSEATGDLGREEHLLFPAKRGIWEATLEGDLDGRFYVYRLEGPDLDSTREVVDPSAINTVHGTTRARITDLRATNPPDWESGRIGPRVGSPVDMVIYEMHVRDFTIAENSGAVAKGRYLGFAESGTHFPGEPSVVTGIDHLVELGVTHVQLLPVEDFEGEENPGRYNWGYMTAAFNSPEGQYATNPNNESRIRELKTLIAALHRRGIGVIMDVVYNHTAEALPFNQIVPTYYYRLNLDGSLSNGSGCGNEFRSEAPMARKFILDSLKYWVSEYGVDGFRFDLMALIDRETMREVERELQAIKPDILLYGEPWAADHSPISNPTVRHSLGATIVGAFNDGFRDAVKGTTNGNGPGFVQSGWHVEDVRRGIACENWAESPGQVINYLSCHDNLVLHDKFKLSTRTGTEREIKETMKLAYLVLFTSQGVPFLHGGEEFGRSKGGHHNSYQAPDIVNQVDWSFKRRHHDLYAYTRALIGMRKAHPIFRLRTKAEIGQRLHFLDSGNPRAIHYLLNGEGLFGETWRRVCVILNGDPHAYGTFHLPEGAWQVALESHGFHAGQTVCGRVSLPATSGLVLYM